MRNNIQIGLVTGFTLTICFMIISPLYNANLFLTVAIILWGWIFFFCLSDIKKHLVFFCFLSSFFVFLLGREICFTFFNLKRYYNYLEPYNDITFILVSLSLVFLFIGYLFADKNKMRLSGSLLIISENNSDSYEDEIGEREQTIRISIRKASQIAFYFCYFISLADVLTQISLVRSIGYLGTYMASNSATVNVLGYFSSFSIVAISLFLGTCPQKKSSLIALSLFEVYGILTMLTGHRYTFIAVSMYFLAYVVYRHKIESGWISKRIVIMVVIGLPLIIVLMNSINETRAGEDGGLGSGIVNAFISFLDQQGGSINCIKRVFYYEDQISDMVLTSLSNTRTVLFENGIVRRILGLQVYTGNSVENALNGHYLSHRLSYLEYGSYYLAGHGVGSCYIAELFHDFSYLGVVIGNLIYGYIIRRVTDLGTSRYFRNGLLFASQYYLYLAPRGDFDGMIGGLFSVTSILGMIGILFLSHFLRRG